MSSSKPSLTPEPPSDSSPPTYTSLYAPSDSKQPTPTLRNLRTLITTNRTTPSLPHRPSLLATMSRTTTSFLTLYSTTTSLTARLSFLPASLPSHSAELLVAAVAADEFVQTERLLPDEFWADEDAARELARDLKRELEDVLGDFDAAKKETGVLMGVEAEEQTWRGENRFGLYETSTGWAVVVRLRVEM